MLEFLLCLLLAGGAVFFVLRPILHPEIAGSGTGEAGSVDEGEDPDDDLSPRAVALRALKEIEFDRATGKLSDADYHVLHGKYTAEALAALRGDAGRGTGDESARPIAASTRPASPVPRPVCPVDGPRPESDAEFC